MRRWAGIDMQGWHDYAARDWRADDPEERLARPETVEGGVGSVVIELASGRRIGGPQAILAPHGRGPGWGTAVGDRSRRTRVDALWRALLEEVGTEATKESVDDALRAAVDAVAVGAQQVMLAIPDHDTFAEAVQRRLIAALKGRRRPRPLLLWRPVALFLAALEADLILPKRDGLRVALLIHGSDGLEVQRLTLRALVEHPGEFAPEREGYGKVVLPEIGLSRLETELGAAIASANPVLLEGRCEDTRLAVRLLCGEAGSREPEILRRDNGTWLEIKPPAIMPSVVEDALNGATIPDMVDDVALTLLATPLGEAEAGALMAKLAGIVPDLRRVPHDWIATGAQIAGRRIERGLPHYLDRLDPIALAVLRRGGPAFEDLIPAEETVPANRTYVSKPITGVLWGAGKEKIEFYIRKGAREIRRWTTTPITPPADDEPVEIRLTQMPAQGWAEIVVTSRDWEPLRRQPVQLDWDALEPESRSEQEILAALERPNPGFPERIVYRASYEHWDGSIRYPGVQAVLEDFDPANQRDVERLGAALRARARDMVDRDLIFPISTDGELPAEVDTKTASRLDAAIRAVADQLMEQIDGRQPPPRTNAGLICVTWTFTRCPEGIQEAMIEALDALCHGRRGHPLLSPTAGKKVVLHGVARTISAGERIKRLLPILLELPQNADTRAALAGLLARREAAPESLNYILVSRLARECRSALEQLRRKRNYAFDFKYVLYVLAGLLRYREMEPLALIADHDPDAQRLLELLKRVRTDVSESRKIVQRHEKLQTVEELIAFLQGTGGDPNLLRMIDQLGER